VKGKWVVPVVAPTVAILFAFGVASLALLLVDIDPIEAFGEMFKFGITTESLISMMSRAMPLYVSAVAVAVGFKMGLFNIGVEGQYLIAAPIAAWVGGLIILPAFFHISVMLIVAMLVGGIWGWIPGELKVRRGVHEVISTIMMNFIAIGLGAYLLINHFQQESESLTVATPLISESGRLPSLNPVLEAIGIEVRSGFELGSFLFIAVILGVVYHLLVNRSRFGFDLRASGLNPPAARASGVDPNKMVVRTMVISGAIAGLVGMERILDFFHQYTSDFPRLLGFNGIAVALLGRNHAVGMAFGALLFGFMDRAALILDLRGVPREIVTIIQGIVVLAVVIAYEVIARMLERRAVRIAAQAAVGPDNPVEVTA
jgi:simple sugar transport system permease protein